MLTLVRDCRSGNRLEIVIPVFNEQKRIGKLLAHYKDDFDLVLLDGGSTDRTLEIASYHGVTVFLRDPGPIYGEHYFAHYANTLTKSGYSFYLFADEYLDKARLREIWPGLKNGGVAIIGKRIDWCYGVRINWMKSTLARGFKKEDAVFSMDNLHEGLICKPGFERQYIDIHHLQIWDMRTFLGRCGGYAYEEIERIYSQKFSALKFIRRFFLFEILNLPKRLWKQRDASFAFQLWQIAMAFAVPLVGLLCLLEWRYLLSPEDQAKRYSEFYDDK